MAALSITAAKVQHNHESEKGHNTEKFFSTYGLFKLNSEKCRIFVIH